MRNKNNNFFVFSVILSVILILSGITGSFFIHKNIKAQVFQNPSKLANIDSIEDNKNKSKDLKTIIHENQKLVVSLEAQSSEGKSIGSGFLYNNKGDIITNAHVVDGASAIVVKMADTSVYRGVLIGKSDVTDIALVRVAELAGKDPMKISQNKKVDVGDEVLALGSPLGLQNTATTGIISGLNRDFTLKKYQYKGVYQISAPISPGNSGGPLLDRKTGEVMGINSAKLGDGSIGFSIPISQVLPIVNNWCNNPSIVNTTENSTGGNSEDSSKLSPEDAAYIISYFYNSLNSKDYVTAYSLLGAAWQQKTPYPDFRKGYIETLSVEVQNMVCREVDGGNLQVVATIQAKEKTEANPKISKYEATYIVGYENVKLKIITGEIKTIQ